MKASSSDMIVSYQNPYNFKIITIKYKNHGLIINTSFDGLPRI